VSSPGKPDLDHLISALTADGRPDELAGRDAALAAFRAASQRNAADRTTVLRRSGAFRRPFTALPGRLTAIAAAGITVVAGVTAAAYTQALPAPVQQVAHTVFAPLGVPNSQQQSGRPAPGTGSSAVIAATSAGAAARTNTPRPEDAYLLTLTAARVRVQAGTVVEFTGRVADLGRAAAGVRVRLAERIAGSTTWQIVAVGVTGPRGGFRLLSPPMTTTAIFRVAEPDGAHSAAVKVTVART
jgi:hypothetical protein